MKSPSITTPEAIIPKHDKALLLVTFGSTYPGPHQTFARIKAFFAQACPDRDIFLAFTSGMCMRRWFEKSGEQYYPANRWLKAIGQAGYKQVSVQSLHIIPGLEYSFIHDLYLPEFKDEFPHIPISVGKPLLYDDKDIARVGQVLYQVFKPRLERGEAWVMMGHGNGTDRYPEANGKYDKLNSYLQALDPKIIIGTVDYEALLYQEVEDYLMKTCPEGCTLNFLPLMSVAGDHALNDMVGSYQEGEPLEEQSWMVRLLERGYYCNPNEHCHLHGLGDYPEICQIWLDHLLEAEQEASL